jgi:hypothetical protein
MPNRHYQPPQANAVAAHDAANHGAPLQRQLSIVNRRLSIELEVGEPLGLVACGTFSIRGNGIVLSMSLF